MGWRCSTTSDYLRYLKRAGSFQLDSLAVEETTLVAGPLLPTEEIRFRLCPEAVPSPFPLTCNVNLVLSHPAPSFWLWLFQICWQYFQIYHIPFGISDLPPFLFSWMGFFFFPSRPSFSFWVTLLPQTSPSHTQPDGTMSLHALELAQQTHVKQRWLPQSTLKEIQSLLSWSLHSNTEGKNKMR